MSYIQTKDYKGRITNDLLQLATEEDPDILEYCDKTATDIITGYVGQQYDVAPEFNNYGLQRNYQILAWALSIAIYHIFLRLPDIDIPEKIKADYDECMSDLENISKGKVPVNLPPVSDTTGSGSGSEGDVTIQGEGLRRLGSDTPRTHRI